MDKGMVGPHEFKKKRSSSNYRIPVCSNNFNKTFDLNKEQKTIPERKKIAIKYQIKKKRKKNKKISIGISDDDKKNIDAIKDVVKSETEKKNNTFHFVIYDTSKQNEIKKIKLTKKSESKKKNVLQKK